MPNNRELRDAALQKSKAMPVSAVAAASDLIDIKQDVTGDFVADCEVVITAPTLTTAQLPDAATNTYRLQHSHSADFGTSEQIVVGVQTGAGGAGAAGAEYRSRLPHDAGRYVRGHVTPTGSANQSASEFITELVF